MGLIQFGGLGSGLDVNSIVSALVEAERAPKQLSLDRQEANLQFTLSGLGSLKSALSNLKSAAEKLADQDIYNNRKVTTESNEFFSASASSTAAVADYDIEVVSTAQGSKLTSNVFTGGPTSTFGTGGTLTLTAGAETFFIDVESTDTLEDIKDNINAATDNFGVNVNLLDNVTVGVDTGSVLSFNSSVTGSGNDLAITYTGDASLADLSDNLNTDQSATDASINIDGFSATSQDNTFDDILEGVTITTLVANTASETTSLSIDLDKSSIKNQIENFVKAYNEYFSTAKELGQSNEGAEGVLLGDYTLRQATSQIRNLFAQSISSVSGDFDSLSAIGITTTKSGSLSLDSGTLDDALSNNFDQFDELFTGDNGFAEEMSSLIDQYVGSNGSITSRQESINNQLANVTDERIALNYRIQLLETRLSKQFAAMDTTVAQFNNTADYLAQQLANLPGFSSGSKDK
ncbi:flagellar filament capping protein FliD [Pleionea sediminis]|uniref:flagellar filament capping protein FliD n=1 Tax=Pleionea sediminis TaxID=2569479 RepID=UPI0011867AEB|nr:flagellar filament capping protein FliD [Pleionea sediminis]